MKTILFQGDSVVDSGRQRHNDSNRGFGFATLISAELGYEHPGEYEFYNRGIGGEGIVEVYARMQNDILNLKPDYMSIYIGVNDAAREFLKNNGVENEKYFKIYSMLIEEVKEALPDIKIMIMEPFIIRVKEPVEYIDALEIEVKKRAEKARELAEKYNLPFISLQDKFDDAVKLAPSEYWAYDGVHPSAMGHEIIKRAWIEEFKKLV